MEDLNLRNYAHLGDAVWELKVREQTIFLTQNENFMKLITLQFEKICIFS